MQTHSARLEWVCFFMLPQGKQENFAPGEVLVSLMRQYTPMGTLPAPFDRKITDEEYDAVLSWMYLNDLEGFTQEAEAADTVYIPKF